MNLWSQIEDFPLLEVGTRLAFGAPTQQMPSSRTNVSTVLNTLENERHARGALIAAFAGELRAAIPERAPESTRTLAKLAKAEREEIDEAEFAELLTDLRAIAAQAA